MTSHSCKRGPSRHLRTCVTAIATLMFVANCSTEAPETAGTNAAEAVEVLLDEVWAAAIDQSAYLRMRDGRPIKHLDDISYQGYQERVAKARGWLARIESVDTSHLDHAQRLDLEALRWDLEMLVEGERWFWHDSVLTPYLNPLPGVSQMLQSRPVATESQRAAFLELLAQVPDFIAAYEQRVRGQAERDVYVWRDNLEPSFGIIESEIAGDGFGPYGVTEARLADAEGDTEEFVSQVLAIVSEQIDPALGSLVSFLRGDYTERTYPSVGAAQLPDGDEYYRYAVRRSTTMDVTPEEVHRRGLALVEEIEQEMAALQEQIGFGGSRQEFQQSLQEDEAYYPKSADEVAERLMDAAEAMERVVDQYFLTRPEAPYGVERLELQLEGTLTYGVYRPPTPEQPKGRYMYNGSKLNERSWLNVRALSLHELVPGHHFHIARQNENEGLAPYRRSQWHTAYTEGWGSYSSWLGLEAGIYDADPLSAYGFYLIESFLATRLVVDTGMNVLDWSLEQGREFMRDHTIESETQIGTESVRYSADMPAQALAYQMGKMELRRLREHAAAELENDFDIREFHEAVLEHGSLPMTVLKEHIDWWIEQVKAR